MPDRASHETARTDFARIALDRAVARISMLLRTVAVVFTVVNVVSAGPWYADHPVGLAAPAVLCGSGLLSAAACRRTGRIPVGRLPLELLAAAAFSLEAASYLPPAQVGDSANWLFVQVAALIVMTAWALPALPATVSVAATCGAYYLGAAVVAPAPAPATGLTEACLALAGIAVVWGAGLRVLAVRASRTDAALAAATAAEADETAALDVARDRREQERLLHDTVLNTLTALARGTTDPVAAAEHCRRDVERVRALLTGEPLLLTGLVPAIRALVDEVPAGTGPTVELVVTPADPTADPTAGADGGQPPAIPAEVVGALTGATEQALSNALRHAHASHLWILVSERPGGVSVSVSDDGVGFDRSRVAAERLGLRWSIEGRVADVDGHVEVSTNPGLGTRVEMSWPAP